MTASSGTPLPIGLAVPDELRSAHIHRLKFRISANLNRKTACRIV